MKNLLVFCFFLLSVPIFGKLGHPFHTSVTEITFNEKERIWEVSVRLFQDDLEVSLSNFQGKKFQFQLANQVDDLLDRFIKKQFGFQVNQKLQTPFRYIGWEPILDVIWVYFEIPTDQELSGVYLQNSLLVETFSDQTNLVHVARGANKKSYLFQKDKTVQQIN